MLRPENQTESFPLDNSIVEVMALEDLPTRGGGELSRRQLFSAAQANLTPWRASLHAFRFPSHIGVTDAP